jgi:hypothetical protein
MRRFLLAPVLTMVMMPALTAPAAAQSNADQRRWEAAQARYQSETDLYRRERDRYMSTQGRDRRGDAEADDGYGSPPPPPPSNGYRDPSGYRDPGAYRDQGSDQGGYADPRDTRGYSDPRDSRGYSDTRDYTTDYDAARDYRDDPRYQERRLSSNDMVYRGSDGRYYCKRSDGTTGLIIGGATGAVIGNVVDGGRNRVAGTLIGGALGALAGRAIDQNSDVRCR